MTIATLWGRRKRAAFRSGSTARGNGARAVQLVSREWIISDGRGNRHEVRGEGVVGEQPVLEPGESFDYVSGCPLTTPTGSMEGQYFMVGSDGSSFAVDIPRFPLIAPAVAG